MRAVKNLSGCGCGCSMKNMCASAVCSCFTAGESTGTGVVNLIIIVQLRYLVILELMRFAAVFGFYPEKARMWVRYNALCRI